MKAIDRLNRNHRFVRAEWWDFGPDDDLELEATEAAELAAEE